MADQTQRLQRLALVAQQYYIEDQKQSDIAHELGISRPLVSRMLREARELGVVEIIIHEPGAANRLLVERMSQRFSLRGGTLAEDEPDDGLTNRALSHQALELLERLSARRVGLGWGHFIGQLVAYAEETTELSTPVEHLCPLVGNAGFPIRNYHSNENVRLLAEKLKAHPYFLYLPALAESFEEKQVLCSTELYHQAEQQWLQMDTALVNVSNYPSTPDFASRARYGDRLLEQRACGRMLAYYYNEKGEIIESDHDFAIQIPLEQLSRCTNVIGLCSANTSAKALRGALSTGLLTHVVARAELAKELLADR